jgi:hypothetical protein
LQRKRSDVIHPAKISVEQHSEVLHLNFYRPAAVVSR